MTYLLEPLRVLVEFDADFVDGISLRRKSSLSQGRQNGLIVRRSINILRLIEGGLLQMRMGMMKFIYDTVQAKTDIWVSGYFLLICMELAPLACSRGHDGVTYVSPLMCTT